jgi:hypothetical protein
MSATLKGKEVKTGTIADNDVKCINSDYQDFVGISLVLKIAGS